MKRCRSMALLLILIGMLLPVLSWAADSAAIGGVRVEQPWARASLGTSRPAAAYFTLVNEGEKADRLTGLSSPAAEVVQIHATAEENGVMRMSPAGLLEIPPGGRVVLEPGSLHVMLMNLRQSLLRGTAFPLELTFEHGGSVVVDVPVFGPGAMGPE